MLELGMLTVGFHLGVMFVLWVFGKDREHEETLPVK